MLRQSGMVANVDDGDFRLIFYFQKRIRTCDWSLALAFVENDLSTRRDIPVAGWRSCLKILLLLTAYEVPGSVELIERLNVESKLLFWLRQNRETAETAAAIILAGVLVKADDEFVLELYSLVAQSNDTERYEEDTLKSVYVFEAIKATAALARQLELVETLETRSWPEHLTLLVREILVECNALAKADSRNTC